MTVHRRNAQITPQHQNQEFTKTLPTNIDDKKVSFIFSQKTHQVTASVIHNDGRITTIKPGDAPTILKKINSLLIFHAYFSHAYAKISCCDNDDYTLSVSQRVKGGAGDDDDEEENDNLVAETMTLMTEGLATINETEIKPSILALVGRTGAGKSLLGNLLIGKQIVGAEDADEKFKFDPVDPVFAVSDSSVASCTKCPGMHSQQGVNYTVVDYPGFGDTNGAYQDIANAFFRGEVAKKTENMKFVLLVPYPDIYQTGTYFADTLKDLIQYLGCCKDDEGLKKAASSITLVVTKVAQPKAKTADSDEKQHAEVKAKLEARLGTASKLPNRSKALLKHILDENRWSIFSQPNKEGANGNVESEKNVILDLINNKSDNLKKTDADIQVKVSSNHLGKILLSITTLTNSVKATLPDSITRELDTHIATLYETQGETALNTLLSQLQALLQSNPTCTLAEFVDSVNERFALSAATLNSARQSHATLEYLTSLLSESAARNTIRKKWLEELGLLVTLQQKVDSLTRMTAPATIEYTNNIIHLHGYFPKTSQVREKLRDASVANVQEVRIYGYHSITFDEDLNDLKLRGVNVAILAPKWNVENQRQVVLSGNNSSHAYTSHAPHGNTWGAPGAKGLPGLPGGSGGNFLGVGREFTHLELLRVISNGGNGSDGQRGGNGHAGENGPDGRAETRPRHQGGAWDFVGSWDQHTNEEHKNHGRHGTAGGDGGEGGAKGIGGLAGSGRIYSLTNTPVNVAMELNAGAAGNDGAAGGAAAGGVHGKQWVGVWYHRDNGWNGFHKPQHHDAGVAVAGNVPGTTNSTDRTPATAVTAVNAQALLTEFREKTVTASTTWSANAITTFQQECANARLT